MIGGKKRDLQWGMPIYVQPLITASYHQVQKYTIIIKAYLFSETIWIYKSFLHLFHKSSSIPHLL